MNRLILSLVFLFAMNGLWINADAAGNQNGNSAPQGGYAYMGDKVTKTDAEWKKRLAPEAYDVLRHEGTEAPFTSPLNEEKHAGIFACAGCSLPLFPSKYKFDSGTGLPSFYDTIPGHVATKTDYKLIVPRTEYHCARCGGHQGHVFNDGPKPTGLRYCNNGVALKFIPS